MFRSFLALALSLVMLAAATAHTMPTAATKKTTRTTRRVAKKSQHTVRNTARRATAAWSAPAAIDVPVVAAQPTGWEAYDDALARQGRDAVYAAPGMNVHIRTGHEMDRYDGTPARKPAVETTTRSSVGPDRRY